MASKSKQKIQSLRVEVRADKKSRETRISRAQVISTTAPSSALWKASPDLQAAGEKVVAAGEKLADADAAVQVLRSRLETAINARTLKLIAFDAAYRVYATNIEAYATTPEDVTGLGVNVFTRSSHALTAPAGIQTKYDVVTRLLQIRVARMPGMQACVVEISSTSSDPDAWQRLPGCGSLRKLHGYPPGTYWVRAAYARAKEMSDFAGPVAVIVK